MDNKTVEALRRFERWVLSVAGVLFCAAIAYSLWPRGVEPPIKGLGQPANILRRSEYTCICYVVDQPLQQAFYDLDVRLQIKGFKRENRWGLSYRRGSSEYVSIEGGVWQTAPDGTLWLDWQQSQKTTVAYTIRTEGWWYPWKKVERNWAAVRATGASATIPSYAAPVGMYPSRFRSSKQPIRVIR